MYKQIRGITSDITIFTLSGKYLILTGYHVSVTNTASYVADKTTRAYSSP